MTLKEHKKHSVLTKPALGHFARNEWAFVGTPCGEIKTLADQVIAALSSSYKCSYVDASHAHADAAATLPGRLAKGAVAEYTDQITYHQVDFTQPMNAFRFRQLFSEMDLVLVNGNHQQAQAQVVVIDERKRASLQKRVAQLTNVQLILLAEGTEQVFDFVQEAIPGWQALPIYKLSDTAKIVSFFQEQMQRAQPVLNGLVLAGGQSLRMGRDKGAIDWHGKAQRYFMADLLKGFCNEVYISCRAEQQVEVNNGYKTLSDTFIGLGPYGAILSAFREQPDAAWLVVACDLPLLDEQTLEQLTSQRDSAATATTFVSPHDGFPEPLITIWEPKSYPLLLSFLAQGYTCPRKVLINSETNLINPQHPDALLNVNTPQELEKVKRLLVK
ncbi:NTP transferase domain-containing protein [Pontibacter sp. E15-1]|uniref:NTP transferase domain-containing protein n=1 Tax=Pontibacter sp. E15-1 TaxID=2919918 RepID=UPI001F4F4CA4|nr:NTP transferase domain-containing protein [Pontibacter sp. E15-1]MCJ8165056.1 NTP transferase domain-containing protein [Pontibacter sp. E15-1]